MIEPRVLYGSEEVFREECEGLFAHCWIYAALADEVCNHNDFVRVPMFDRDVVIQNFSGTLRAFVNSCSHRHSQIQIESRGNRPFVCPYHGWTYDERGVPVGIPCREDFPQVTANPENYRLQSVGIERAGDFLFLRLVDAGPDLRTFLGETYAFLEQVSAGLARPLDEFRSSVGANWKIVIENSLEGYHVPLVHRLSLGAIRQFSREKDAVTDFCPESGHNYMHTAGDPQWLRRWSGYRNDVGRWPFEFDYYVHQMIFPILTVTSFLGYSFHVQRFYPEAVDSTNVYSRIYASKFENQTERGAKLIETICRENVDFTHRIFEEDRLACERTHRGSVQARHAGILGEVLEKRIRDFRATYARARKLNRTK